MIYSTLVEIEVEVGVELGNTKNVNNRSGHFVRRTEKSVNKFVKQINQKPILNKNSLTWLYFNR